MISKFTVWLMFCFAAGAAAVYVRQDPAPLPSSDRGSGPQVPVVAEAAAGTSPGPAALAADRVVRAEVAAVEIDPGWSVLELSLRLRRWAGSDPAGFLESFPALAGDRRLLGRDSGPLVDALKLAAEAEPNAVLAFGEVQSGSVGVLVRSVALEMLAASDPAAALDWLAAAADGDGREHYLAAIATGYARADLDGAVAWLAELEAGDGAAVYPVINAVALVELSRAIELDLGAIERDLGGLGFGGTEWLRNGLATDRFSPARIADQLAALKSNGLLADALGFWATQDPYGAIAWIQSQPTISRLAIERLAGELGRQDYALALNLSDQFPPALRTPWVGAVLGSAAEIDVVGVLATLESFRGEPFFDDVNRRVLQSASANLGPLEAARIAGTAPPPQVAAAIVTDWVRFDPEGAAAWVLALEDANERSRALSTLVYEWTEIDAAAVEDWIRDRDNGELPDGTLGLFCARTRRC